MARLLVIPDVHQAIGWADAILGRFEGEVDRTIFLGDYFDSWEDGAREAAATAAWLRNGLGHPRRSYLFGNHDISYCAPGPGTLCSGWTEEKAAAIGAILRPPGGPDHWASLGCFHLEGGWLFTHAGLRSDLFSPPQPKPAKAALESLCRRALDRVGRGQSDPVFGAGRYRLGSYPAGGVTWLDFSEAWERRDLLVAYHQVVGHSVLPEPRSIVRTGGVFDVVSLGRPGPTRVVAAELSYTCIDSKGRCFAIVDTAESLVTLHHCREGAPLVLTHQTQLRFALFA